MNLGTIKSRVKRQFGDESGAQITNDDITHWANQGQLQIVRKTRILKDHKETSSSADISEYVLPTDAIIVERVTYKGKPLLEVQEADLDVFYSERATDGSNGTPTHWYLYGRELNLWPTPDTSENGAIDIFYVRSPVELDSDDDIPEIPLYLHEDIIKYCVAEAKALDEDSAEAARIKEELFSEYSHTRGESDEAGQSYPSVRLLPGDYG